MNFKENSQIKIPLRNYDSLSSKYLLFNDVFTIFAVTWLQATPALLMIHWKVATGVFEHLRSKTLKPSAECFKESYIALEISL